jgi:hypothetical protein
MNTPPRATNRRLRARPPRGRCARGGVTLELIIAFPIWLCILLATIEFGWLMSNLQQVALASRLGAAEASQTEDLSSFPDGVKDVIATQLESAGMKGEGGKAAWCHIIVEHNLNGTNQPLSLANTDYSGEPCSCSVPTDTEIPYPDCKQYVRVTVCAPMTAVAPDLLGAYGFAIDGRVIRHTTTYRYELTPAASSGTACSCTGP